MAYRVICDGCRAPHGYHSPAADQAGAAAAEARAVADGWEKTSHPRTGAAAHRCPSCRAKAAPAAAGPGWAILDVIDVATGQRR